MAENTENVASTPATEAPAKIQLTISGLKADLKAGLDRKQIAKKYGITQAEITRQFKHPKLKGLRVNRPTGKAGTTIELVDDTEDVATEGTAEVAQEGASVSQEEVTQEPTPAPQAEGTTASNSTNGSW